MSIETDIRSRGYLPHLEVESGTYFVTFRLAGSLPKRVLDQWAEERQRLLACLRSPGTAGFQPAHSRNTSPPSTNIKQCSQGGCDMRGPQHAPTAGIAQRIRELFSEKVDAYLDAGAGECHLRRPEIADIVANALRHFDGDRYQLHAWCVMPNHVHVVFTPYTGQELSRILHSWKSYTATKANRALNREGVRFWQVESYDHLIRDDEDFARCVDYTENNPVVAGLCARPEDFRWSSAYGRQP